MPATKFKLKGGWAKLEMALDPSRLDKNMRRHLRRANRLNGKIMEAAIREVISSGKGMVTNRALTAHIKGENKPLVGPNNSIFQAVTSVVEGDLTVFAGILATNSVFNIAETIHEGTDINVTSAMRGMFFMLWKASSGQSVNLTGRAAELFAQQSDGWFPLKDSTSVIVIPSRPFVQQAFKAAGLVAKIRENWTMAIQAAIRDGVRG